MQQLKILNTRELKKLREHIVAEFGTFLKNDYAYLQNDKGKIFLINKDLSRIELKNLKIDRIGLYFAESKDQQIRLSKEGAQLLFTEAKGKVERVVSLDQKEAELYFQGREVEKDLTGESRSIILKYQDQILGCARYKDKKILNFLPKIHRRDVVL